MDFISERFARQLSAEVQNGERVILIVLTCRGQVNVFPLIAAAIFTALYNKSDKIIRTGYIYEEMA